MFNTRSVVIMAAAAFAALGVDAVSGQDFPNKPIRILAAAAGVADVTSRQVGQAISGPLGQPVIIENRPTLIGADTVAKAPPDGHTLLASSANVWITPLLQKLPYDPVRDFSPITLAVTSPSLLVVHPSLPVKSVKELIDLAKARPGKLNYSAGDRGGTGHLGSELFKSMAGVNIVGIFYASGSQQTADMLSGEVQLTIANAPSVEPHIKSGRLKALAVTSAQPSALFPGLPTVAASGVPGYEIVGMMGFLAPSKTPPKIINQLNQEMVRYLNTPAAKTALLKTGLETVGNSPEEFVAVIKSNMSIMGKLIKDVGIKGD